MADCRIFLRWLRDSVFFSFTQPRALLHKLRDAQRQSIDRSRLLCVYVFGTDLSSYECIHHLLSIRKGGNTETHTHNLAPHPHDLSFLQIRQFTGRSQTGRHGNTGIKSNWEEVRESGQDSKHGGYSIVFVAVIIFPMTGSLIQLMITILAAYPSACHSMTVLRVCLLPAIATL